MSKPKLLAWCDFLVPTGFGNVAMNLLQNLHEDFEVSVVGINYYGQQKYDSSRYFVFPVSQKDQLGIRTLLDQVKLEKPEVVFLFQDIFHIAEIIHHIRNESPKSKIVVYFPIDGYPMSKHWEVVIEKADIVITYSDFAIQVIKSVIGKIDKPLYKLYHGVDTDIFKPITSEEIAEYRKSLGWANKFVMVNVNRFQPRKSVPTSIRAFSLFAKGYKKCSCGNIYPLELQRCDLHFCGPEEVIEKRKYNRSDVMYYLHMMAQEMSMGPGRSNILQQHIINAGFTQDDVNKIIAVNAKQIYKGEVSPKDVNIIYNLADVNITSALGEGAGLSLLESQAVGIPSIAPNNSAIPEQLRGLSKLVKNIATFTMPFDNGHLRPLPDAWDMALKMEEAYNEWIKDGRRKVFKQECVDNINDNFLWQDKREFLRDKLLSVVKSD